MADDDEKYITNKSSTTAAQAKAWTWEAVNLGSSDSASNTTAKITTYTSSAKNSGARDWAKPSLSSKKATSSKNISTGNDQKKAESVNSAVQTWYNKMTAFLNKDTDTAAGNDLKEDEPLSVPDISKEMRSLSSTLKSTHPLIQSAARETLMLTAAMVRQQVVYGRGRSYYYNEHQEAVKSRKERVTARTTKINYVTGIGEKLVASNTGTA